MILIGVYIYIYWTTDSCEIQVEINYTMPISSAVLIAPSDLAGIRNKVGRTHSVRSVTEETGFRIASSILA